MRISKTWLAAIVAAVVFLPSIAGASDLLIEEISQGDAIELKARWSESRKSLGARSRLDEEQLIVPFFVVDTSSPAGVTTLFAVQADIEFSTPVRLQYEDLFGTVFKVENRTLAPSSVLTINLRDKSPPVLIQGLAFGRVVISTNSGLRINGDYYQVDPGGNFGHGDGLVSVDDWCLVEDVRFATGGIFDDTIVAYSFLQLTSPSMGGSPAALVEVYTETGSLARTFQLLLPPVASRSDFASTEVWLDQLGGGPAFGTLRFYWNPETVLAGVTKASTSAQGRFSVGLQGACRLGLIEVL